MGRTPDRIQEVERKLKDIRNTVIPEQTLKIINEIFEMPGSRMEKCRTLYGLVSIIPDGNIVELGTYHGNGAIILALSVKDRAANHLVLTVDDYKNKNGWAGESYIPEDEDVFWKNMYAADVQIPLSKLSMKAAAEVYRESLSTPISFLFWDLGTEGTLRESLISWIDFMPSYGLLAIHDTADNRLGARDYLDGNLEFRYYPEVLPGGIHIGIKK